MISPLGTKIIDVIKEDLKDKEIRNQGSDKIDYRKLQNETEEKGLQIDVYV